MLTTVIFEGPEGLAAETPTIRFVGAAHDDVVTTAHRERDAGADRVELCGALGPVPHARVRQALGPQVPVGAVMYGFESLETTTEFKRRFARGEQLAGAFLHLSPGADPVADRLDAAGTAFVPVPEPAAAGPVAAALVAEGVTLLELYGGLGPDAAAAAVAEVEGRCAVGLALYPAR